MDSTERNNRIVAYEQICVSYTSQQRRYCPFGCRTNFTKYRGHGLLGKWRTISLKYRDEARDGVTGPWS
jgi:hypothetical protein